MNYGSESLRGSGRKASKARSPFERYTSETSGKTNQRARDRFKAKAPADFDVKVGETIHLEMDEAKVHFFNAETGMRIL